MRRSGGEDCDCDGDEVDDVSVPSRGDWQGVILAEAAGVMRPRERLSWAVDMISICRNLEDG